jgi:hypothetical protein
MRATFDTLRDKCAPPLRIKGTIAPTVCATDLTDFGRFSAQIGRDFPNVRPAPQNDHDIALGPDSALDPAQTANMTCFPERQTLPPERPRYRTRSRLRPAQTADTTFARCRALRAEKKVHRRSHVGYAHNDGDLAIANPLAAVAAGAVQVQGWFCAPDHDTVRRPAQRAT